MRRAALLLLVVACAPRREVDACNDDLQCDRTHVCVDGECVVAPAPDDAGADAGGPPVDGGGSLDAGAPVDGGDGDAGIVDAGFVDAGFDAGDESALASCAAWYAFGVGADGVYRVDPDGAGPAPAFDASCDMTNEGGGWTRVELDQIGDQTIQRATPVVDVVDGGARVLVYANGYGCGSDDPGTEHDVRITDKVPWTQVRFRQTFTGRASCWTIFEGENLRPFDDAVDVIRDEVQMGGDTGSAFDGDTRRCDLDAANFWEQKAGTTKQAVVVLRRQDAGAPAGLRTHADCVDRAEGTDSPTTFTYDQLYVR